MNNVRLNFILVGLLIFNSTQFSWGQFIDSSPDRVKTPLKVEMKRIGTIKPRSTKEIESSRLTVGCETIDRDHVQFGIITKIICHRLV
jgi:hypothetical protein